MSTDVTGLMLNYYEISVFRFVPESVLIGKSGGQSVLPKKIAHTVTTAKGERARLLLKAALLKRA